jgi:adenylate cyclase
MTTTAERRLTTIMFTDMVGYSALAQQQEALALALLDEQRRLLRAAFARHGGREIEAVGDGFFVEFPSALGGAECAVDIQQALAERNAAAAPDRRIRVRIGLHLGDVVQRGTHVHGDGVNIAARIEPLAEPGGICVSEDIARQIQNKIALPVRKLGKGELKNIRLPVDIYRLVLPGGRRQLPWSEQLAFAFRRTRTRRVAGALLAMAMIAVSAGAAVYLSGSWADPPMPSVAGRHRIAVLPFSSISADPSDEYFADGITEELISRLSRIRELEVIARTSVMTYKGARKDIADIGRELNVGTVLEGSVRKASGKVRVTAQLISVGSQAHLWSEDYDRQLADVFAIQSEIAQRVAAALSVRLGGSERQRVEKKGTTNLDAYQSYLLGRYHWNKQTEEGLEQGKAYFEQAIREDPTFAQAYAGLAQSYELLGNFGLLPHDQAFPKAEAAALRALQLDDGLAEAHSTLGNTRGVFRFDWPGAESAHKSAIALDPNAAYAYDSYGIMYLTPMGRHGESIAAISRAIELDPLSVLYRHDLGWVLYFDRQFDRAIREFEKAAEMEPNFPQSHIGLGLTYAAVKKYDKSIAPMRKYVDLTGGGGYTIGSLGWAYAMAGRKGEALQLLVTLTDRTKSEHVDPVAFAFIYAGLGEKDDAFEWLNKAYKERNGFILAYLKADPVIWSNLRSDPRFDALLAKVGLNR